MGSKPSVQRKEKQEKTQELAVHHNELPEKSPKVSRSSTPNKKSRDPKEKIVKQDSVAPKDLMISYSHADTQMMKKLRG